MNLRFAHNAWRFLIIIGTTFLAFYIPLEQVFNFHTGGITSAISVFFSFIFLADLVYSLRHYSAANRNSSHKKNNYVRYIFIFDLIALLPFHLLTDIQVVHLFTLVKLVKVGFYLVEWRNREIRYSDAISITAFIYWSGIAAHSLCSIWLMIHELNPNQDEFTNYINSLYWVVTTLTTVGYGDITPIGNLQTIFTMVVEILGVGFYGFIIGKVAAILSKKDPAKAKYLESLEKLSALSRMRKLPPDLQKRLREYYEYVWTKRMGYDESEFLKDLPKSLQGEVSKYLKKDIIEKIPFFSDASSSFIESIALNLKPLVLTPGDILFHKGDAGSEMYFVLSGELIIQGGSNDILAHLKDGDFFGEMALFRNQPRSATVQAITYCELYCLDKNTFDLVLKRHPDISEKIKTKVERVESST